MKKFKVSGVWSGYSRGTTSYIIEADTPEEAEKYWYEGEEQERIIVRDDTEFVPETVMEVLDE